MRIDERLVEEGLAENLALARALVMEGRVFAGEQRVEKPSQSVKQPAAPQHAAAQPAEHFQSDMNGLMEDLFATVTRDAGVPLRRLTQAERAEIVARLYEQGMFELRGAVQFTVHKLACSQASIYRYIKKVKSQTE